MKKIAYFLLALSLLLFFISVFLISYRDLTVIELPVEVSVGNFLGLGFDLNDSKLNFDSLLQGSSSTRHILITNPYDFPAYAAITTNGNISPLLRFDTPIYFLPGETRRIGITVLLNESIHQGGYSGMILFHFRRAYHR